MHMFSVIKGLSKTPKRNKKTEKKPKKVCTVGIFIYSLTALMHLFHTDIMVRSCKITKKSQCLI